LLHERSSKLKKVRTVVWVLSRLKAEHRDVDHFRQEFRDRDADMVDNQGQVVLYRSVKAYHQLVSVQIAHCRAARKEGGDNPKDILPDTVRVYMTIGSSHLRHYVAELERDEADAAWSTIGKLLSNNRQLINFEHHGVADDIRVSETLLLDDACGRFAHGCKDQPEKLCLMFKVGCLRDHQDGLGLVVSDECKQENPFKLGGLAPGEIRPEI